MNDDKYQSMIINHLAELQNTLDSINGKLTFFMIIVILGLIISFLGSCLVF